MFLAAETPEVLGVGDAPHSGAKRRKSLGRSVFRPVIDNEDLIIRKGLVEHRSNGSCDFVSAVEGRNDNAYSSHCQKRARTPARKRFASTKASQRVPGERTRFS